MFARKPCRPIFQRVKARHQPQPADRGDRGQPHHRCAARVAPAVGRVRYQREGLIGAQEKPLPFRRQRDAARASLEQFQAEPAFQLGDLPADRAMRDVEMCRGGAEASGPGGRLETAKRFQRQHGFQAVIHTHNRTAIYSFVNQLGIGFLARTFARARRR